MAYPNFKNKHLQEALFHPEDFLKYNNIKGKFPTKYIITYQSRAKSHFLRIYKPKKVRLYSLLTMYIYKDIGFIKMSGIGAPISSAILEELISLGGKEFLNIGTAGGLDKQGVFLCTKALRDEGTSHHYLAQGRFSYPNQDLTTRFEKQLKHSGIPYREGTTWTIDAPYRETKAEIEHYKKQGIATVEMEASALFAVAQVRKVKLASAFVVSDILGKEWKPKFKKFDVVRSQNQLIDAAVEFFAKRG